MDYSKFLGWLLLNLAVPLLAPVALLPLLGSSKRYRGRVGELLQGSLREGQLFWTVIAMCAAAWYEAAVRLGEPGGTVAQRAHGTTIAWTAIGWHTAIIVISAVLVLLGTMDAVDEETQAASLRPAKATESAPGMTVLSLWIALITAASFTATHLWATRVLY